MSGINLVLNIAKDALLSQQVGINVSGHNIANANTEGYSRQRIDLKAKEGAPYCGVLLGRGVEVGHVLRVADRFVEERISERTADSASFKEAESYMSVLEGIFNETSKNSISSQITDFWNGWHDLSNNPSGMPERAMLHERAQLMTEAFNSLDTDLATFNTELTLSISSGVEKINQLTAGIAEINNQIVGMASDNVANDLRDKRGSLLKELSNYVGNRSFEEQDGSLTVIAGKGHILAQGKSSYDMAIDADRIKLLSYGDTATDITDWITGGKLGAWLDMRDEIIPKYKADLSELAKSFIGEVNKVHSQGVGLSFFDSAVTGTYETDATGKLSTLDFGDEIDYTKDLTIWADDGAGTLTPVVVDLSGLTGASTLTDLRDEINAKLGAAGLANWASVSAANDKLTIDPSADAGYTYAFSDDGSNILAALGINTFFDGDNASGITVNSAIDNNNNIAAAKLDAAGAFGLGDNSNALDIADIQYQDLPIKRWTYSRGSTPTSTDVSTSIEDYYRIFVSSVGIKAESVTRGRQFSQSILAKLTEIRDSVSAVSIDDEMTNLIKYQHAYSAAAKLITVANEMLQRLVDSKT